jgi:hypothetical protein
MDFVEFKASLRIGTNLRLCISSAHRPNTNPPSFHCAFNTPRRKIIFVPFPKLPMPHYLATKMEHRIAFAAGL